MYIILFWCLDFCLSNLAFKYLFLTLIVYWFIVFPVAEFNYCMVLAATTMTVFIIPIMNFYSNLINQTFYRRFLEVVTWNQNTYTRNPNPFSHGVLGICPAFPSYFNQVIVELFVKIFSYNDVRFKMFKTFISFTCLFSQLCMQKCYVVVLRILLLILVYSAYQKILQGEIPWIHIARLTQVRN